MENIRTRFLENRDDTGRFIVTSLITGVQYYVEPMEGRERPRGFGDIDPATKKVTGSYGDKYRGAIDPEDSMITEENGFKNISVVEGSPMSEIDRRDKEYEAAGRRIKVK